MPPESTNSIQIVLNGEPREIPSGLNLAGLLGHLGIPADRVAIEFDEQIIRRMDWSGTPVHGGARIEIVHFVGGG